METEAVVADIAVRLARLEKSNRRLRLTLGAVVAAASSLALGAAGRQDSRPVVEEIRATRFIVADADGSVRGVFGSPKRRRSEENDGVELRMMSADGTAETNLTTSKFITQISQRSDRRRFGVQLLGDKIVGSDGGGLRNEVGGLRFENDGLPVATLAMAKGGTDLRLGAEVLGDIPETRMRDWSESQKAGFRLINKIRLWAPVGGDPSLQLLDNDGRLRLNLGGASIMTGLGATESRPTSSIVMFGPDGSVVEKLPR